MQPQLSLTRLQCCLCILESRCSQGRAQTGFGGTGINGNVPQTGIAGTGINGNVPQTGIAGTGNGYLPQPGAGGTAVNDEPYTGDEGHNPIQIAEKALQCFNDKNIYSSCEEAYRLTQSGNLNVPLEYTDQYCGGPCLSETHHVLDCINGVLSHFLFYNQATVRDVEETIKEGCSYGPKRGDFNVAEHIQEYSSAFKSSSYSFMFGLVLLIPRILLF